ncbi:hypothetical protein Ahy_B04g073443 [Arachis hypogaea]|uniref:Aminotransferase-like plant mobile domain-containing protein n=1 Tax=Arachis hypogaea TaxID=3818 RepID=A0A444ZQI1_ARAHY|nr:hypothetical protein Ahy_B04g073443 [Arachis hypogaea]
MMLLSTQLFGDKSGIHMHIRWLPYLARLEDMDRYSWGSATLSWLYRCLYPCLGSQVVRTLNEKVPRVAHCRLRINLLRIGDVSVKHFKLFIVTLFCLLTIHDDIREPFLFIVRMKATQLARCRTGRQPQQGTDRQEPSTDASPKTTELKECASCGKQHRDDLPIRTL